MKEEEKALEKLVIIEKALNDMLEARRQITELRESETQRQKALEDLRERETEYRTLVDHIPQRLFMKDRNGVYILCNQNYSADLGIQPEEIGGKTAYDLFPRELAEKYTADDKRVMDTGQAESIEERYICQGQTFLVQMMRTPIKNEKGQTVGIAGILWDITEQKRQEEKKRAHLDELVSSHAAELLSMNRQMQGEIKERQRLKDQLQEVEEMYRALFDNSGAATVVIEERMTISIVNREFEKLSGYAKEEVEGKRSLSEFIMPGDFEKIEEAFLTGITKLDYAPKQYETRFKNQSENFRDVQITVAIVPGAPKAVVSIWDITDRKWTSGSLRNLEERYEALMENIHEAVLLIQDGRVRMFNQKISGISGYTEEELTSKPFKEMIHPEDRDRFELYLKKIEQGEQLHAQIFRLMDRNGQIRFSENRGALTHWEGKPAVFHFMTDITDRRNAEEELRNAIKPFRALVNAMEKTLLSLNRE
jgi:PAS domain S-box-containing protein